MLPLSRAISHALRISFLISTILAEDQTGLIAQYLDDGCTETSLTNPTVSLPLDTCLVARARGLAAQRLPRCPTSNATLQVYQDPACAIPDSSVYKQCIPYDNDVIVVMFICGSVADANSGPTSTTTASAGSALVPVAKATEATTASASGDLSSPTATGSNGLVTSAAPMSSASDPSQASTGTDDGDASSGLSHPEKVTLGVALSVGCTYISELLLVLKRC